MREENLDLVSTATGLMEYSSPDSDSRPVSSPNFHGLGLGLGLEGLGLGLGLGLLGLEDSVRVLARVL